MKRTWVLVVIAAMVFCAPAFATQINDNANSSDYVVKAPAMMVRGATNAILSPLEVLQHTYQGTIEGRPILGTVEGFATGVMWGLDRAGRGAWDILTSLFPRYNGAPPTHELSW